MNGSDIFALTAIGAGVAQMASTAPAPNWVAILTIVSLVLVVLERLGKVVPELDHLRGGGDDEIQRGFGRGAVVDAEDVLADPVVD